MRAKRPKPLKSHVLVNGKSMVVVVRVPMGTKRDVAINAIQASRREAWNISSHTKTYFKKRNRQSSFF